MAWKGGKSVGTTPAVEDEFGQLEQSRASRNRRVSRRTIFNGNDDLRLSKADLAVGMMTGIGPSQVDFRSLWTFAQIGLQIKAITGVTTVNATDPYTVYVCGGSGVYSVTLPPAASSTNRVLIFKRTNASNNVTIDGNASEEIDGATTKVLSANYDSIMIVCDGTDWHIIANYP